MRSTILIIFSLLTSGLQAQGLQNTTWKTEINNTTYSLEFLTDSLNLFIDIEKIELSTYQIQGDTLILQDHEGANCLELGHYNFQINNDSLTLRSIMDDCPNRENFLDALSLEKCITTGINNSNSHFRHRVFPNPSPDGLFYLEGYDKTLNYNLYTLNGRQLALNINQNQLDLSPYNASVYILEIVRDNMKEAILLFRHY